MVPQSRDETGRESDWELDWELGRGSDRRTEAASGAQCSCSWPLDPRTHRTGLVESRHKPRRNQRDWMRTEEKRVK